MGAHLPHETNKNRKTEMWYDWTREREPHDYKKRLTPMRIAKMLYDWARERERHDYKKRLTPTRYARHATL